MRHMLPTVTPMTQTPAGVTLDKVLRRELADRRWSGRQLAAQANLNPSKVARILRGDRDCTVGELTAIAAALGVTPSDLIPADAA